MKQLRQVALAAGLALAGANAMAFGSILVTEPGDGFNIQTLAFNGSSFANDNNTAQYFIPAYNVWDFTFEVNVWRDNVSVIGGINNLFDTRYYARIRSDGIDPAAPRNWYVGVQLEF